MANLTMTQEEIQDILLRFHEINEDLMNIKSTLLKERNVGSPVFFLANRAKGVLNYVSNKFRA